MHSYLMVNADDQLGQDPCNMLGACQSPLDHRGLVWVHQSQGQKSTWHCYHSSYSLCYPKNYGHHHQNTIVRGAYGQHRHSMHNQELRISHPLWVQQSFLTLGHRRDRPYLSALRPVIPDPNVQIQRSDTVYRNWGGSIPTWNRLYQTYHK